MHKNIFLTWNFETVKCKQSCTHSGSQTLHISIVFALAKSMLILKVPPLIVDPRKRDFIVEFGEVVFLECTLTVDSVVDACLLSLSVGNGYYAYRLQHMLTLFIDFMGIKTQQLRLLIIFYLLLNHSFTKYSCMHPLHTFYSVNEKLWNRK